MRRPPLQPAAATAANAGRAAATPRARHLASLTGGHVARDRSWCRGSLDAALARVLVAGDGNGSIPHVRRPALRREPHIRRLLLMGQYALHLRRWLRVVPPHRMGVLWVEQFKADPFACLAAVERFTGLEHHSYRSIAAKNQAGLWVVGKSKSSSARPPKRRVDAHTCAA